MNRNTRQGSFLRRGAGFFVLFLTFFFLNTFGWGGLCGEESDDFFAPASSAHHTTSSAEESAPSLDDDALSAPVPTTALEEIIPGDSLVIFRTATLTRLNKRLQLLLSKAGLGKKSPMDWFVISPFYKASRAVDLKRAGGFVYLSNEKALELLVFLPVNDFSNFAKGLGAETVPTKDLQPVPVSKIQNWSVMSYRGFALLFESSHTELPDRIARTAPFASDRYTPSGFTDPDFSLEVTRRGIERFSAVAQSAIHDLTPVLLDALVGMGELPADLREKTFPVAEKAHTLIDQYGRELSSVRFDGKIRDSGLLTATIVRPLSGTSLARQIDDRGGPMTPTRLDSSFLLFLPDAPAGIAGQVDITPDMAAPLEPPFHRIRHIEYSLALPYDGEFLAEPWCFFLEVDDTDAFIRELIVPKAQMIGKNIASDTLSEIGGQLLGNISSRRATRGRRVFLGGSPEEAMRRGQQLGALIGNEIGAGIGEKEAMKTFDFEGYKLYVSDLELYTRQMRIIRAKEQGELPPQDSVKPIKPLIGTLLSALEDGSIEGVMRDRFGGGGIDDGVTLIARENLILVLDKNHLLIVPGNREVLHQALAIWKDPSLTSRFSASRCEGWRVYWDILCQEMNEPSAQILRSAHRIDLYTAQQQANLIRAGYFEQFPQLIQESLPEDLPPIFSVSSTAQNAALFYSAVPSEVIQTLTKIALARGRQSQETGQSSTEPVSDH